jgi:hypothetical protein
MGLRFLDLYLDLCWDIYHVMDEACDRSLSDRSWPGIQWNVTLRQGRREIAKTICHHQRADDYPQMRDYYQEPRAEYEPEY